MMTMNESPTAMQLPQQPTKRRRINRPFWQNSHEGHHYHRHLSDIQSIIEKAHISKGAKKIAQEIFLMIGKAESKIHDMPLETIHFHEISGVDSIIDIVGNAVMIDKLQISKVYCTPICTGFGMVKTQHGMLPVPAPATAELLKGMPIYPGEERGENTLRGYYRRC